MSPKTVEKLSRNNEKQEGPVFGHKVRTICCLNYLHTCLTRHHTGGMVVTNESVEVMIQYNDTS